LNKIDDFYIFRSPYSRRFEFKKTMSEIFNTDWNHERVRAGMR